MGWLRKRLSGERAILRTHRAPFQAPEWEPGQIVGNRGVLYVVTRWEELPSVHLDRGGSVPEWEVWGRPAGDEEVAAEAAQAAEAAERILSQSEPPTSR